jgi:hypothetical protein
MSESEVAGCVAELLAGYLIAPGGSRIVPGSWDKPAKAGVGRHAGAEHWGSGGCRAGRSAVSLKVGVSESRSVAIATVQGEEKATAR